MTGAEFIAFVGEVARKDWIERRIMLPSVVIAQAVKESAKGTSELALRANALFGVKLNGWTGKSYRKVAFEQNNDGSTSAYQGTLWRAYDSWEESIIDHNTYIAERILRGQTEPNFKAIIGETNVKKVIAGLVGNNNRWEVAKRCTDPELRQYVLEGTTPTGYATSLTYAQSLLDDYILKYNLTQYDVIEESDSMKINKNTDFKTHNTSNRVGGIKYIAIHYVGATGDADANVKYYNRSDITEASADFFVGHNGDIWQYNPDPIKRYCYAVGGGRKTAFGGSLFCVATNNNTVNIEMCVKTKGRKDPNSPDWYITDKTLKATIELTRYLMKKYNVPAERVIRHFDVNGKLCPGVVGWNYVSGSETAWNNFKKALTNEGASKTVKSVSGKLRVIYQGEDGVEVHNTPDFNTSSCNKTYGPVGPGTKKGSVFTVKALVTLPSGDKMYRLKSGLYITAHKNYVQFTEQTAAVVTGCSSLNVRQYPNGKKIVGTLKGGEEILIVDKDEDSDGDTWYKVEGDSVKGYVWPKYVRTL